ncbi:Receptor-like serine/threonine-protein kinase ALE2 isoform D [Glycine soja]|uniref:Receptor-like serine/threonine-protein kinase ALE2 isoform D n=1 Tax=Glycine soja TaxID=3848 RepID=A0A445FHS5_GLYSO|nr:Receptor-like serine/threonine-protein kinase ALE2 isoform D [Glycine soja]
MSCVVFIQPFLELTALCNYLELTTMSMCDLEFLDKLCKSGTCIHIPGFPPMKTDDLPESSLLTALNGARFVYFDRRLHETALVVAHEEVKENIPILMDAGRLREGLDDLVKLADYVVCAARFLQAQDPSTEEVDVDKLLESLQTRKNGSTHIPTCISSSVTKLHAEGVGTVCGSYLCQICTRENAVLCCYCGSFQVQSSWSKKRSSSPHRSMLGILHAIAFFTTTEVSQPYGF